MSRMRVLMMLMLLHPNHAIHLKKRGPLRPVQVYNSAAMTRSTNIFQESFHATVISWNGGEWVFAWLMITQTIWFTHRFFQFNQKSFPRLAWLAQDYLCCMGTSCTVERTFSTAAHICTNSRGGLVSRTIERSVGLCQWLKQGFFPGGGIVKTVVAVEKLAKNVTMKMKAEHLSKWIFASVFSLKCLRTQTCFHFIESSSINSAPQTSFFYEMQLFSFLSLCSFYVTVLYGLHTVLFTYTCTSTFHFLWHHLQWKELCSPLLNRSFLPTALHFTVI